VLAASVPLSAAEIAPVPRHVKRQLRKAVERKEIKQETARQIMRDISQGCFASRMDKIDPKKAIRLAQRYQDDADWMRRMGFDVSVARTINLDQYFRLIEPRNFVRESMTTAHYQMGNQATYSVEMGPVNFTFQGAMVWMIAGNRVKTTTNDEGTFTSCTPTFNFLRAGSGWAPEVTINPVMLDYMPIGGSYPVYGGSWLKGYLTRQVVQTHVAQEPDSCQDYTANYVYRYQYHAPDGNIVAFYQRPEEKPQTSSWGPNPNFCGSRTPFIPREPDHYWSSDGNASLDTTNKCRPVIRWSDGSVEEFNRAFNEDTPMVTSEDAERLIAEPYSLPTCSAEDWQRDLHLTDRNGNVVTFNAGGMYDAQGRRTSITTEPGENGFTRLRTVELPSIGNAPPHRYTIEWKQILIDFAQIWPDVQCHEQTDGLLRPCTNSANPQDYSMPTPDLIDVVDYIVTPDGRRYTFEYGPWGNLTRVTEPGGAVREWIYGGAANLGYANAVTQLLNRPEEGRCLGSIWTDEIVKMQARGVTEERVYPNGLPANPASAAACSAGSSGKCFYPTTYSFALRQLPMPHCQDQSGGIAYPGCTQLWKTTVLPDGTITKTGSSLAPLLGSWWRDDQHVSLAVDQHGLPVGEETYSGGQLVSATYTADPDTGTIWTDGDVIPIRGSPYAVLGNTRPTRTITIRDGLAMTTNFFYGNWIDIDPAPDVTLKRHSTEPTSVCTFGGIAAVSADRVNDGCTLSSAGNPLLRTETSYLNYFDSSSLTGRILLDLPKEMRTFGPNAAKTGFSTVPLAAQTTAYDESSLAPSGRPASVLNTGVGTQRGNATTVQQRVDATRTISVKTRYFDDGSIQSVTDPRGYLTTHYPDFSLCSASATLTEKQTNHLGHTITTVQDCVSGLPLRVTDANGRSLYTQYDYLGRVVENAGVGDELTALPTSGGLYPFTRDPGTSTPTGAGSKPGDARVAAWTEYLELGDPQRQRVVSHLRDGSAGGRYSKVFTDGLGRAVQTRTEVDPAKTGGYAESVSTTGYDGMNRTVAAYVPCFAGASDSVTAHCSTMATKTTYDVLGRELSVLKPGNRLTSHRYTQENGRWLTTTTDPRNFTTKTFTDLLGRVVQMDRQSSLCAGGFCSTTMSYDAVGRMLHESDAGGNTIDYTYDMLGRRITMADPDMGKSLGRQWVYEYDEMGNLIAQTDAKGQRIELKYDPLNRITLKDMPPLGMSADDVTYFYDGQGPQPPDNPAPAVTSISPTSSTGSAGLALTVSGSNFTPGSVVRFNGQDRATTFVSANELTAVILASDVRVAGAYPVVVFTSAPGGGTSAAMTFTSGGGAAAITSMTPQSVGAGSMAFTLTVNGSNFVSGSVVTFNGQNRPTTFVSTQRLTAAIPATDVQSSGTRSVTVVNPGAGASAPATFTITSSPVSIAALAPPYASAGNGAFTLTVHGSTFQPGVSATFNGQARQATYIHPQQMTVGILAADVQTAGSYPLTVINPDGSGATVTFTVMPPSNGATFVSQSVPSTMIAGQTYSVTLTMKNSGGTTWSAASNYELGSAGPQNNSTWGRTRVPLSASVAPGAQHAFQFNVTAPATAGTYSFQWQMVRDNTEWFGQTSAASSIAVTNPAPSITLISPASAAKGGAAFTLTVNGSGFVSGAVVTFNGQNRTTTFVNAAQLTASIPATDIQSAGTYAVTVVNPAPGGGASAAATFTVNNPGPAVSSLSPASATRGGAAFTLSVNGSNFATGAVVTFNGQNRTTTFVSASQLTASIPATDLQAAGAYAVTVVNPAPGGGASTAATFTVNNPAPAVSSLSPASATKGGAAFTLTVNGSNFVSGAVVTFNGQNRTTTFVSATQLTASIPATDLQAAGTYAVTAVNPAPGGGASAAATFTVNNPAPAVSSLSPASGTKGGAAFTLTVNGSNFATGAVVTFNGQNRTTTFVSATQVTAAIPATDLQNAGGVPVTVVNPAPGGGASAAATFTVNNPAPIISSIAPAGRTVGSGAFTLTVNGSNFVSGAVVAFNGAARPTTFVSATQLTAAMPASDAQTAGTFAITVLNPAPGGGASNAASLTIGTAPTVSLTAPANGAAITTPADVTLTASATGAVSKVEFFRGSTLLGTATAAPYSVVWTNAIPGTYVLTAKATTSDGIVVESAGVTITVNSSTIVNATGVYNASADFSTRQGQANWYYLDSNGVAMNWSSAEGLWQGAEYYNRLWQAAGHPGAAAHAVRQWVAPVAGTIRITGNASDGNVTCGNGATVSIWRGTQMLWQQPLDNVATVYPYDLTLAVPAGEQINFVINSRGDYMCDATNFNPTITYVPQSSTARASADFSGSQGVANWYYLDSNGTPMSFFPAENMWRGAEQYNLLGQTGGHPGAYADAVRQWKAPVAGTVRIRGNVADNNATCGNGVVVFIRKGTQVLWQQTIENGNATGFAFDLTTTVAAGDPINFVINNRGGDWMCDGTNFDPSVVYTTTYRASTDYSSTQGQANWYYRTSSGALMNFNTSEGLWRGEEHYSLWWPAGGHPGPTLDAVRQWRVPLAGSIRITGNASDGNATCGNGVIVSIRRGTQLLWQQTIENGNATGFAYDLSLNVQPGELLNFVINSRGGDWVCDGTNFDPTIQYVAPASYTASTAFSSIQGQGGWHYVDGNSTPMTFFPAENMWRGGEQYLLLWSVGGHPGAYADAVRQWKAPVTGTVRITGNASDGNATCGNGVIVSIRRGAQVLWQQAIDNANATGFAFDVTTAVTAGEAISFAISNRGGDWVCDSTNFDPTVQYTPGW